MESHNPTPIPSLLPLLALVRQHFRGFFVLTLALALGVVFLTRPKQTTREDRTPEGFSSHASILLPGGSSMQMRNLLAHTGRNRLQFWLANEEVFENFLLREKVSLRVEQQLRARHPELSRSLHFFFIQPLQSGVLAKPLDEQRNPADEVASDYAQIDEGDEEAVFLQRRINRIAILTTATTAEGSKLLAEVVISVLRKSLEEVATGNARQRIAATDRFLTMGHKKIARLEARLTKAGRFDPERASKNRFLLQQLQDQLRSLGNDNAELARQISQLRQDADQAVNPAVGSLSELVATLERDLHRAEQLFLPGSQVIQGLRGRIAHTSLAAQRERSRILQASLGPLNIKLNSNQMRIESLEKEIGLVRRELPSAASELSFAETLKELARWETETLGWEQQRLGARIEARLAEGEGSSVLLQSPLPGTKGNLLGQRFFKKYRRTFTMLPLAPLVAMLLVLSLHFIRESQKVRRRAEFYFDAPVLGELPSLSASYRKQWRLAKEER